MSVPVAPKKSSYSELRDSRNGAKNNNDRVLSLGDANANPIMLEVGSSSDEPATCALLEEVGNANSRGPESSPRVPKEFHPLQGFAKPSQAGPTGLKDFKFSPMAQRERNEEPELERGADHPQALRGLQGPGLPSRRTVVMGESSLEVLAKREADVPRPVPKDKSAKTLDNEELRRHSLERASSSAAAVEVLTKEWAGGLAWPLPQSTGLGSPEAPHPVPSGGEGPLKTETATSPGPPCPPVDGSSEGKGARHPKPSTSVTMETVPLETQPERGQVPKVSAQSTVPSAHPECSLDFSPASKDVPRRPEAQAGPGKVEPKTELKPVQPGAVQEFKSTQVGDLGCRQGHGVSPLGRKEPAGEVQSGASAAALTSLAHGVPHPPGAGRDRGEPEKGGEDGSLRTTPKPSPGSLRAADQQPTARSLPSAAWKLGEMVPNGVSPRDGHVAFVHGDSTDSRPSGASDERGVLRDENNVNTMVFDSDSSIGERETGVPEPPAPPSSRSEAEEGQEVSLSVAETRNHLEPAVKTESPSPARADVLGVPVSLHPETTVNVARQPPPPSSRFQDLGVSSVDVGSPPAALPPADSTRLSHTSPKVPAKNTCPGGLPRPEDTPASLEGTMGPPVEKREERADPRPIVMPKPKHVRPKIITYIRRSPQALGQVDASLVPVGLPYAPPACSVTLPKEDKVAGGDLKPAAGLYEKFKPDLQRPRVFSSGLVVSGIKPPGHPFSPMSEKFLQEVAERPGKEEFCSPPYAHYEVPPTFYRSAMLLKPQLGLGAMSRLPSAKSRILIASQRSSAGAIHPPGTIAAAASLYNSDPAASKQVPAAAPVPKEDSEAALGREREEEERLRMRLILYYLFSFLSLSLFYSLFFLGHTDDVESFLSIREANLRVQGVGWEWVGGRLKREEFSSVAQSCLFATPWTAAHQASLSITNSRSLLKLMSIESVMPSSHLGLENFKVSKISYQHLERLLDDRALRVQATIYFTFFFFFFLQILYCLSHQETHKTKARRVGEYSELISFRIDWLELLAVQGTLSRVFSNTMASAVGTERKDQMRKRTERTGAPERVGVTARERDHSEN
ncbi:hypothetical protein FD755_015725 [Muntiacus reevesi]|uniref:Uncharacterized protein n=1 Tax=Muntiacus reevesi TaxID=9886 RepID=A0A5N3XH55_MUNRE|nr:hypothetical protein FD755_015725 [Muntiacus reevesi]